MRNETIAYYDHNARAYGLRSREKWDLDALREFTRLLPPGAHVLDAGCGVGRDLAYFHGRGFLAEGVDASEKMAALARITAPECKVTFADLQLLSLPRESLDGIWAHRSLVHIPAQGCQRVLASFFSALKSKGILFVSIEEGSTEGSAEEEKDQSDDPNGPARTFYRYRSDDFASLIRQSGFQILSQGRDLNSSRRIAFIARRI